MGGLIGQWVESFPWVRVLELVVDVYLKAAVVCALAGLVTLLLRRSSAYARSMVWVFTLVVLLALPLTQAVSPVWQWAILPGVGSWWQGNTEVSGVPEDTGKEFDAAAVGETGGRSGAAAPTLRSMLAGAGWRVWFAIAWVAGVLFCLVWLLTRVAVGKRLIMRCCAACETWDELLSDACARLDLGRHVRLYESGDIKAAVTIGAINPAIVVPAGSTAWPIERRRYILSHELAHVKRWDGLVEILVLVTTSIYWLNPLVWLAAKQLRIERERDCDDVVLNAGAKPSDYAMFLMDIAAELGTPPRPAWQLSTISQGSNLKDRIMCILDPKINRKRGARATVIISCFLILSLILPLSMSGIWETQAQEKAKQEECKKEKEMEQRKKLEMKKKMGEKITAEEKIKLTWEKIEANENSAAVLVHKALMEKGPGAGAKMVKKIKAMEDKDCCYFDEKEFNTLGYKFLLTKKVDEAIEVFKLNVKMYPESWNVYDSLGEGYLVAGKYDKAKKYYEKSLVLNPENENGKEMLVKVEKLKNGESVAEKE